jgi:transcriptional regulator with XRE-family HTH domain
VRRHIRDLRKRRGLTQEALCERAGVSVDAITRIESGKRTPTLATIERIAHAFRVSPAELLDPELAAVARGPSTAARRVAAIIDAELPEVQEAIEVVVQAVAAVSRR